MKNTTFVSAGAGSGKTYRLTQEVVNAIKNYKYRGDELIMTTYTTLAANELREEVRSALYKEHLYEAAVNIDNYNNGVNFYYMFAVRVFLHLMVYDMKVNECDSV